MRAVKDGLGVPRHLGGWRPDRGDHRDFRMSASVLAGLTQPTQADLSIFNRIPVYDQLSEGSCGANMGATQVLELEFRAGRPSFIPSRQNLYKAARIVGGTPLTEDSGVQIRDVYQAMKAYGVCSEALDPYRDDVGSYSASITDEQAADALRHRAIAYYRCVNLRTIKASILQGFSVGYGFTCYESLMSAETARTGEVRMPEPGEKVIGGHANVFRGFDDTRRIGNSVGALRSRNSWGKDWGDGGDLWLPYQFLFSGLASDFWTLRSGDFR